jgi:hypothetical protein
MSKTLRASLRAILALTTLTPSPLLAIPPHSSEGECANHVVDQYNTDGDWDGLEFGLDECHDIYADPNESEEDDLEGETITLHFDELQIELNRKTRTIKMYPGELQEMTISKPMFGGSLVLLPPYGSQGPQSLSDSSSSDGGAEPRRR